MAGVQDERWEFDLDLPRSPADYPVLRSEVVRAWRDLEGYLDRLMRERLRPPGYWR
jgi:hypothetical protein